MALEAYGELEIPEDMLGKQREGLVLAKEMLELPKVRKVPAADSVMYLCRVAIVSHNNETAYKKRLPPDYAGRVLPYSSEDAQYRLQLLTQALCILWGILSAVGCVEEVERVVDYLNEL